MSYDTVVCLLDYMQKFLLPRANNLVSDNIASNVNHALSEEEESGGVIHLLCIYYL